MELQGEDSLLSSKRVIKRKVPLDYNPHEPGKKVSRKGKKRPKVVGNYKKADFKCENCGTESFLKGNEEVRKCRHVYDAETRKTFNLCNACGLKLKRKQNRKEKQLTSTNGTDKDKYLQEGRAFGRQISELVGDEDAKQFFCPKFRGKPCKCLQTFMQCDIEDITEVKKRANLLLRYHKKSKELMHNGSTNSGTRSKEFDHFILTNRDYLKSQLRLCEQAVQKVLGYSNNFLYKNKGEEGKRLAVKPTVGSTKLTISLGDIVPIHEEECNDPNCKTQLKDIPEKDIASWRERSTSGQTCRNLVIQEMVERCSGQLCRQLIQVVTGAGITCIARVTREGRRQKELNLE